MKRLTVVLAVLSVFALSAPVVADVGVDTKKTNQPTVNFTWGDKTCPASATKADVKAAKGQNIKKAAKGENKKPCDYIK